MNASHATLRRATAIRSSSLHRSGLTTQRQWARHASGSSGLRPRRGGGRFIGSVVVFGAAAAAAFYYPELKAQFGAPFGAQSEEEPGPARAELQFEKPRPKAESKEDNRDLISSQHLQVKNSWEHPGVYVWGSNVGKVIDSNSSEKYIKLPRRLPFFDNQLLRDLKLTQSFGAAVTENGDLVQWGVGLSSTDPSPKTTLKGKDIVKIDVSADRIIALTRNGAVYSVPSSRDDQEAGHKTEGQKSSWSLWTSTGKEDISFRNVTPRKLGRGENITDISSGLEHCLMLTTKGRVFAAASSAADFPSKGQMGIPGLSWETRPDGPYDQAHEVTTLEDISVDKIATGDFHSVVLTKSGKIFAFGDNSYGQLGFRNEAGVPVFEAPAMLSVTNLYGSNGLIPKVTSIFAGGQNTFFTVDASAPGKEDLRSLVPSKRVPRGVTDLWAVGHGVYGSLGTGKWTHVSGTPTKVKDLSSLFEFDEKTNKMMPIKLKSLSVGSTHCSAIMGNLTETSVSSGASGNETNWGSDVVFWGGNEYYQLGTGKRTNLNTPTYIGPLDGGAADAEKGRKGESHRLSLTPRQTVRLGEGGKGRKVTMEQKVECGQFVTGVYSAV